MKPALVVITLTTASSPRASVGFREHAEKRFSETSSRVVHTAKSKEKQKKKNIRTHLIYRIPVKSHYSREQTVLSTVSTFISRSIYRGSCTALPHLRKINVRNVYTARDFSTNFYRQYAHPRRERELISFPVKYVIKTIITRGASPRRVICFFGWCNPREACRTCTRARVRSDGS